MTQDYKNILVAVDGSDEAELAFQKAVSVCLRNKAHLLIAHIIDTRAFQNIASFDETMVEQATGMAKQTIAEYVDFAKKQGLTDVKELIEYGAPKPLISKEIPVENNIDLIMLGATGLNAVERLFMGSVSEYVIRHAPCDVLIVRTNLDNKK